MKLNRNIMFTNGNLCGISYGHVLDAINETDSDPFEMTVKSQEEWSVIAKCVNIGIDGHLEAITDAPKEFDFGDCNISPHNLCILLRRLSEGHAYENDSDWEIGRQILDGILTTIGFDDAGDFVGREALGLE